MGQSTLQRPNRRTVESETPWLQQKILRFRRVPHGPREIRAAAPIITGRLGNFAHAWFRWSTSLNDELAQIGG
jgi:hypothetical protein